MNTFSPDQSNQSLKPFGPSVLKQFNHNTYNEFRLASSRNQTRIKSEDFNLFQTAALYGVAGLMFIGLIVSSISLFTM